MFENFYWTLNLIRRFRFAMHLICKSDFFTSIENLISYANIAKVEQSLKYDEPKPVLNKESQILKSGF